MNRARSFVHGAAALVVGLAAVASAGVTNDGTFTQRVPVAVPPGPAGMQPTLALSYDSSGGDSFVGLGWQLEGLPQVVRTRVSHGVRLDATDHFLTHQGVLVRSGASGPYRAQADDWGLWHAEGACGNGPCSFRLEDREGRRWYFGETTAARVVANSGEVAVFALSRVVNPDGLEWRAEYLRDGAHLYPRRVRYTFVGGVAKRRVEFSYADRPATDRPTAFGAGVYQELRRRLVGIAVYSADVLVRRYELTYDEVERRRSLLRAVQEIGDDDSSRLPALTFDYAPEQPGPGAGAQAFAGRLDITTRGGAVAGDWLTGAHRTSVGDFDGDGKSDLLLQGFESSLAPTDTKLWLSSTQAWVNVTQGSSPRRAEWSAADFVALAGDFTGDGLADVALLSLTTAHGAFLMRGNGDGTFVRSSLRQAGALEDDDWALSYQANFVTYTRTPVVGDFDGDGALDVLLQPNHQSQPARLWFSDGAVVALGSGRRWAAQAHLLTAADFDGDGVTDVLSQGLDAGEGHALLLFARDRSYRTVDLADPEGVLPSATRRAVPLDANGDGLMDLLLKPRADGTAGRLLLSRGTGFVVMPGDLLGLGDPLQAFPGDYDGDGRDDVALFDPATGALHTALQSNGRTLEVSLPPTTGGPSSFAALSGDFDGDGRADLVFLDTGRVELWQGSGQEARVLTRATNGSGGHVEVVYTQAAQHASARVGVGAGRRDTAPRALVTQVTSADGTRGSVVTRWTYSNARLVVRSSPTGDQRRVAPLGFLGVEEEDAQTHQRLRRQFAAAPFAAGLPLSVEALDADGERSSYEETLDFTNQACADEPACAANGDHPLGLTRARPTGVRTTKYEAGAPLFRRTRAFTYDAYGNPTRTQDTSQVWRGGAWLTLRERFELNEWINQTTPVRAFGLPWQARVCTAADCATVLSGLRTTYDGAALGHTGARLLASKLERTLGSQWIATAREYDDVGNLTREVGPDGLATTMTYDADFHRDRVALSQPGEPAMTFAVDHRYGLAVTEQDENGTVVTTTHDAHGRPVRRRWVGADGRVLRERAFVHQAPTATALGFTRVCDVGEPGQPLDDCTTTFIDSLLRTRRVTAWGAHGLVEVTTEYDAAGRPWRTSEPHLATEPALAWTTTEYDAAGRVARVTHADGSVTAHRYNTLPRADTEVQMEQVVSPTGAVTSRFHDLDDHVVRVTEGTPSDAGFALVVTTRSTYDLRGQLERVDTPGKVTALTYDALGRKTSITDPDTGRTEYTYDDGAPGRPAWGRLLTLSRPSPNGGAGRVTTSYTYDAHGRVAAETTDDGASVTYEYDDPAVANALGKLTRVTQVHQGVTLATAVAYDGLGNRTRVLRAVSGPGFAYSGVEQQRFDVLGRLAALTYSDGAVATYRYHGVSRAVESISLGDAVVARYPEYTPRGQAKQVQYGNGVTTDYTYAPETGLVDRVRVRHAASGAELYDVDYGFDAAGNVASIGDRLDVGRSRRFTYDGFGRLTRVREGACLLVGPCRVLDYAYDTAGNLTQKEGTSFTLVPGTGRVASDGVDSFTWSEGGNLLRRGELGYRYDRRNMLASVFEGPEATPRLVQKNHHDQDGRRLLKERFDGVTVTRTFFLGRLSELTERRSGGQLLGGQYTRFILGPDGQVVASVAKDVTALRAPSFFGAASQFERDTAASTAQGLWRLARAELALGVARGAAATSAAAALLLALAAVVLRGLWQGGRRRGLGRRLVAAPLALAMVGLGCTPRPTPPPAPGGLTEQLPPGTHFFHADHLGSVALVTDGDGAVTARLKYLPYGDLDPTSSESPQATRRFTGQRFDPETQLYAFNARYYDPTLGRFTSADTLVPDSQTHLGFNRYAYAKDNPIRYTDPSGHGWFNEGLKAASRFVGRLTPLQVGMIVGGIVATALAPLTGGASLILFNAASMGVGLGQALASGQPNAVTATLVSGVAQMLGLPVALAWSPATGWGAAVSFPLLGGDAAGLKASLAWYQRGGFDAGVSFGTKDLALKAGWSQRDGAYVGAKAGAGPVSVQAKFTSHGVASYGATYDNGALQVDVGFRTDKGVYLGVSHGFAVDSGLGEFSFRGGVSATFDGSSTSLSATMSHAQFEAGDASGLTGMLLQQASEGLKGERYELELL